MQPFLLVLIAPSGHGSALATIARDLAVDHADIVWSAPRWLGANEALEMPFDAPDVKAAQATRTGIATRYAQHTVDICVVSAEGRRKMLLVADMDSTIIGQECIDEMADVLGLKARVAEITERAMRGELQFEAALRERLALLRGLEEDALEKVWQERLTLDPGARTLVATMNAAGASTALVSGGFTYFTSRVATAVGFHHHSANTLETIDGRLTGRVVGPISGREGKRAMLERLARERHLASHQTLAVGDGANDLDMITAAGLGVAFHAKPIVAAQADAAIAHSDLTALLYLQGYRRDEFVTSA